MFDIGWGELLLIGAVALVVIGPKDLPRALRTLGQMTGKMRRMAAEFQSQFNEAIREAEMDEIRRSVADVKDTAQSFNPIQTIRDEIKGAIDGPKAKAATELPDLPAQPTVGAPLEDSAIPAPVPVPPPPSASAVAPVDIPPIAVPPVPDAAASVAATAPPVPPSAPPPVQAAATAAPARRRRATGETKATGETEVTGEAKTAAEPKVAAASPADTSSGESRPKPRRKPAAAVNGAGEAPADPTSAAKPRSRRPAAKPAPTDEGETP